MQFYEHRDEVEVELVIGQTAADCQVLIDGEDVSSETTEVILRIDAQGNRQTTLELSGYRRDREGSVAFIAFKYDPVPFTIRGRFEPVLVKTAEA